MKSSSILLVDALINLALGLLLIPFPEPVIRFFGLPETDTPFYAGVLGAVLVGIGLALLVEYFRHPGGLVGLGLGGAIAINLCGGLALAAWLIWGELQMALRGRVFLWGLVAVLVGISGLELFLHRRLAAES